MEYKWSEDDLYLSERITVLAEELEDLNLKLDTLMMVSNIAYLSKRFMKAEQLGFQLGENGEISEGEEDIEYEEIDFDRFTDIVSTNGSNHPLVLSIMDNMSKEELINYVNYIKEDGNVLHSDEEIGKILKTANRRMEELEEEEKNKTISSPYDNGSEQSNVRKIYDTLMNRDDLEVRTFLAYKEFSDMYSFISLSEDIDDPLEITNRIYSRANRDILLYSKQSNIVARELGDLNKSFYGVEDDDDDFNFGGKF